MKKSFLDRWFLWILTYVSGVIYLVAAEYYFLHGQLALFGDAKSRLLISRGIFDSLTPGLVQLGGVWPPFPQLFYLPTVWLNAFLYTGISGTAVSGILALIGTYFFARLLLGVTKSKMATILGTAVLVLNPSFLYMSVIPMSEIPFLSFIVISACFLYEWIEKRNAAKLSLAGFFALFASLTRYEGYMVSVVSVFVILFFALQHKKKLVEYGGYILLYAMPAFLGVILWLLYNQVIFGSIFHFVQGETLSYSRAAGEASGNLTKGNMLRSWNVLLEAFILNAGAISVFLSIVATSFGFLYYKSKYIFTILVLLSPSLFNLITLYLGASDIFTFSNATYLYNTRLGLLVLPAVALSLGIIASMRSLRWVILVAFLIQTGVLFSMQPITLQEAINSSSSPRGLAQKKVAVWLITHPTTGKTLISFVANQTVIFDAHIPLHDVISENNGYYWENALLHPGFQASRIIISPTEGDTLWRTSGKNKLYFIDYHKVYETQYFLVYDIREDLKTTRRTELLNTKSIR